MQVNGNKRDNTFGLQLDLLLKAVDISQTKLASLTNVPRVSINRYIRGQSDIRSSDVIKLLFALGIDLKEIIYNHLKKISKESESSEDIMEVAQDIESVFKNLNPYERKTYIGYLVNHAKALNPQIPQHLIQRLKRNCLNSIPSIENI